MHFTDWLISLALILLVLRQVRGRPLSLTGLLWPVGLVVWAAVEYLDGIPSERSDVLFAVGLSIAGLALGLGCGLLTQVYPEAERVMARATGPAVALWIVGMGGRLAFGVVALHGGAQAIARMSAWLDLHSAQTWPTALILMALCEVLSRTVVLMLRYRFVARGGTTSRDCARSHPLSGAPAVPFRSRGSG